MTIGLTYSRLLSDKIAVGLTANYISEKLDLAQASGFSFNVVFPIETLLMLMD